MWACVWLQVWDVYIQDETLFLMVVVSESDGSDQIKCEALMEEFVPL